MAWLNGAEADVVRLTELGFVDKCGRHLVTKIMVDSIERLSNGLLAWVK